MKRNFWVVLFIALAVLLVADSIFAESAKHGRRYLKIGGAPMNENRQLEPGEEFMPPASKDFWAITNYRSKITGKVGTARGWVPAGTVFATVVTDDPTLRKAIWIKDCGNDVLNPENKAIYFRVQADVPAGRQIAGSESSSEGRAFIPTTPVVARASTQPTTEKKCFGKGTWMTGAGTLLTGVGVGVGHWGYLLAVPGLALTYFGAKDEASDPACKAVAAVVGGIGGYAAGHTYKVYGEGGEPSSSLGPSPPPPGNN